MYKGEWEVDTQINEQRRIIYGGHRRINSVQPVGQSAQNGHRAPMISQKNRLCSFKKW